MQIPTLFWWRTPTRRGTQITNHVIASRDTDRHPSARRGNFDHPTVWKNGAISEDFRFCKTVLESTVLFGPGDIERNPVLKFFAKLFSFYCPVEKMPSFMRLLNPFQSKLL